MDKLTDYCKTANQFHRCFQRYETGQITCTSFTFCTSQTTRMSVTWDENSDRLWKIWNVWISKQYDIKILQPFWTSGCRQSYSFVQRKGLFLTVHIQKTQTINTISNLCDETGYTYNMTIYSFLDGEKKFSIEIFISPSWKIYRKQKVQVAGMELHSTKIGVSWSMTVTHKKCRACTLRWYFWDYHAKVQFHKFGSWNFLCKLLAQNRHVSEIKWKLWTFFKISLPHAGTKYFYCIFRQTLTYLQHNLLYFIFSSLVHKI
jgi:hypothetical protein